MGVMHRFDIFDQNSRRESRIMRARMVDMRLEQVVGRRILRRRDS